MAVPPPTAIAKRIAEAFDYASPPIRLTRCLVQVAQDLQPGIQEEVAYEHIGTHLSAYQQALSDVASEDREAGRFPRFEVVRGDRIVGYAFPRPDDTSEQLRLRQIVTLHQPMVAALQEVPWDVFERFCRKLLTQLGATRAEVKGQAGDQGVDFVGVVPMASRIATSDYRRFEEDFRLWVVGQAKAYPNRQVGPSVVREVIGTLFTFRTEGLGIAAGHRLCDPVVPMLATTGTFSRGARRAAKEYGVVLKDVNQIATFLCVEGVGICVSKDGTHSFSEVALNQWVHGDE